MQPGDLGRFGLERIKNLVGVVGLDPGAEKARRHRQVGDLVNDFLEFEPDKPGAVDILADRGLQPRPNPIENVRARHGLPILSHDHFCPFVAVDPPVRQCAIIPSTTRRRVHRHQVQAPFAAYETWPCHRTIRLAISPRTRSPQ